MQRQPEPELMDLQHEVDAYASADFRDVNARFVKRVLEVAPSNEGSLRVVDLGCGPGEITISLAMARPSWEVLGIDASSPMLQIASKRAARELVRNVRFRLTDVRRLAAEFGPFDLIVSNSLLHHVREPNELWDAIRRVAAPGATVLVRDLFRPPTIDDATAIVESYAGDESDTLKAEFLRSLCAAYSVEEVRDQLRRLGMGESFTVEAVSDRHLDVRGVILP
jgi:2-polyprenyl-3-methyl-5-hydroxy-6-metoxy-1,4-benzoquinol methylase